MSPVTIGVRLVIAAPDATCAPERLELAVRNAAESPLDVPVRVSETKLDEGAEFSTEFTTASGALGRSPQAVFNTVRGAVEDEYEDADVIDGRLTVNTDTSMVTRQFGRD